MTDLVKSNRAPASDAKYVIGNYNLTQVQLDTALNHGVVKVLTATNVLSPADSGKTIVLNNATGFTTTLPTAVPGMRFRIVLDQLSTDAALKITVASGDCFYGQGVVTSTTADKYDTQIVVKATAVATPTSYDWLIFDNDAQTSGASAGSCLDIVCITALSWMVSGVITTAGNAPSNPTVIYAG